MEGGAASLMRRAGRGRRDGFRGPRIRLARLGLGRIGELWSLPRGALTARFGREVTYRLDQALGRVPEPLSPRPAKTSFWSRMIFPEPIGHRDHIMTATAQ